MSRRSRDKGARVEREIVNLHRAAGVAAERVPLSGAAGGSFAGDLVIDGLGRAEVKARGNGAGFALLERWLGNHDALFLRRDRALPLVVLPWGIYLRLLTNAQACETVPVQSWRYVPPHAICSRKDDGNQPPVPDQPVASDSALAVVEKNNLMTK